MGIVRQAAEEGCEKRIFRSIKGEVPHRAGHDQHAIEIIDHRSLKGGWWSGLVRDIDHIVESICGTDGDARFRAAPATLTFHGATDLGVVLDCDASGHRQALDEPSSCLCSPGGTRSR